MLGKLLVGIYFMILAVPPQNGHERESTEICRQWEASKSYLSEEGKKESLMLRRNMSQIFEIDERKEQRVLLTT